MEQRVYVGGLPADVTAQELRDRFGRFVSSGSQCRVTDVELPPPKPLTPKGATRGFAYLTLRGDDAAAQSEKLHQTFNRTKWRGGLLKVQAARLRYDLKLQQERAERRQKVEETLEKRREETDRMQRTAEAVEVNTAVKFKGRRKTDFKDVEEMDEVAMDRKEEEKEGTDDEKEETHDEKEETDEETETESEAEAKESDDQEADESEVLGEEDVEAFVRRMEQEAEQDEQAEEKQEKKALSKEEVNARRLAALEAKQQRKKDEKLAIPPIGATLGKKITFDDSGNEEEPEEKEEEGGAIANWMESDDEEEADADRAARKTLEFEGDEEADAKAFALRPEFVGEKGRQLFEMQKRFGGDARFRLDARFLEEEDNEYGGNDVDEVDVQEVEDEAVAELQSFLDEENPEEAARHAREMRDEEATALRVVAKLFPDVDVARLQWRMQNQRAPKEPLKQAAWMGELKRYDPRDAHACREFEIPMATAASGAQQDAEASAAPAKRDEKEIPTGGDRFFSTTGDLSNLFSRVRKNSEDGEEGEAALDGVFSVAASAAESAGDASFKLSSLFSFPVGEDKPLAALGEQLLEDEQDEAAPTVGDWAFAQGFNHAEDDAMATDSEAGDDAEADEEQATPGAAQTRVKKSVADFLAFGRTFVGGEQVADWPERRKKLTLDYKRKRRDAVKTKKRLSKQSKANNARKKARL
jgi:hypothetical protein